MRYYIANMRNQFQNCSCENKHTMCLISCKEDKNVPQLAIATSVAKSTVGAKKGPETSNISKFCIYVTMYMVIFT